MFPRRPRTPRPYTGLDHLLYNGRGVGGQPEEAVELHVACFMGLVSFLAGRLEVLRVMPWHAQDLLNAAARANIQTATVTSTPLTDAGLNGTGEVIQVGGFYKGNLPARISYILLFCLLAVCFVLDTDRENRFAAILSPVYAVYAPTKAESTPLILHI